MQAMKDIGTAIDEATRAGLLPVQRPQKVYLLMHHDEPVGAYIHEDVAKFDQWMCNASADGEYKVIPVGLYHETMEEIECHE